MISSATKTIIKRELKSYFATPLGYVFVIIFLFSIGYVTFEPGRGSFFLRGVASLDSFFTYIPWLYLILIPAISMRLWSDERKTGTIELLFTLPISVKEAVLGKFLAAWLFSIIALLGTFPMVLTVSYLGTPDYSVIFLGYLGSTLMAGAMLAIGSFFSALTKNNVISFILTVVIIYLLLMAGSPPSLNFLSKFFPNYVLELVESLSFLYHFEMLGRGLLKLSNIWFFIVMMASWLYGCVHLLKENKAS